MALDDRIAEWSGTMPTSPHFDPDTVELLKRILVESEAMLPIQARIEDQGPISFRNIIRGQ